MLVAAPLRPLRRYSASLAPVRVSQTSYPVRVNVLTICDGFKIAGEKQGGLPVETVRLE